MTSIAHIAWSGMQAANTQPQTSAHNIANLDTPGFRRQQATQTAESGGGRSHERHDFEDRVNATASVSDKKAGVGTLTLSVWAHQ